MGLKRRAAFASLLALVMLDAAAYAEPLRFYVDPSDGGDRLAALLGEELPQAAAPQAEADVFIRLSKVEDRWRLEIRADGALRLSRDVGAFDAVASLRIAALLVRETLSVIEAGLSAPVETSSVAAAPPPAEEGPSALQRLRLVAGAALTWWASPGDTPNLGFSVGGEFRGDDFWFGGEVALGGVPCCDRSIGAFEASSADIQATALVIWPFAVLGSTTLAARGGAGFGLTAVKSTVVTAGSRGTTTTSVGPAAVLRAELLVEVDFGLTVRLSGGVRVNLPGLQLLAPASVSSAPLDLGTVTPTLGLGFPLEVF
ncbi:MAG: hypothetical protein U1E65_20410 [Myxococcota bacterium]